MHTGVIWVFAEDRRGQRVLQALVGSLLFCHIPWAEPRWLRSMGYRSCLRWMALGFPSFSPHQGDCCSEGEESPDTSNENHQQTFISCQVKCVSLTPKLSLARQHEALLSEGGWCVSSAKPYDILRGEREHTGGGGQWLSPKEHHALFCGEAELTGLGSRQTPTETRQG